MKGVLPERYRRLWSRRLRRRPLLPFLLLAIVAVDAVLFATVNFNNPSSMRGSGIVGGQIGLLAIWLTHSQRGWISRACFTVLALIGLCYFATANASDWMAMWTAFGALFVSNSLTAIGVRWLIHRLRRQPRGKDSKNRFSIGVLLLLMTLIAVLAAGLRSVDWSIYSDSFFRWLVLTDAAPVAIMLALSLLTPRGWRSFVLLVVAPGIVTAINDVLNARGSIDYLTLYYSYKAFVIGLALWFVQETERRDDTASTIEDEQHATPEQAKQPAPRDDDPGAEPPATLPLHFDAFA